MNRYKKYCPNVFIAVCDETHEKGDIITLTTKYGKENEHEVHNFVGYVKEGEETKYCYSITRTDGTNSQTRAEAKAERLESWQASANRRGSEWQEKSNEGAEFLRLAEPIKVGHHSEKRHRGLIERNWNRMSNAVKEYDKAASYESRIAYWNERANKIDLSMPESIDYFETKLEEAIRYHKGLKDGTIKREHSFSLTYANKEVKELTKKVELAKKLWG